MDVNVCEMYMKAMPLCPGMCVTVLDRSNLTEKSTLTRSWSIPLAFLWRSLGVPLIHVYLERKIERVLKKIQNEKECRRVF